jgi:hypothetical protein
MESQGSDTPAKPAKDDDLLARLRDLCERILARRGGKLIDIDIVNMVRQERDDEILDL